MKQENISLLLAGEICYLFVISTGYRTEIIFVHIISTMCPPSNSHLVNHTIHGTRGRFFLRIFNHVAQSRPSLDLALCDQIVDR
jgi:hypothetical protein